MQRSFSATPGKMKTLITLNGLKTLNFLENYILVFLMKIAERGRIDRPSA